MGCSSSKETTASSKPASDAPSKPVETAPIVDSNETKNDAEKEEQEQPAKETADKEVPSPTSNKPFSTEGAEDVIITSQEEDQADDAERPVSAERVHLTVSVDSGYESTDASAAPEQTEEQTAEGATAAAPAAAAEEEMPAPMVKRTSVKDRIKRVNSMERRSTSGRYAPDSPLLSQKLEYDYLIKMVIIGDLAVGKSSLQVQFVEDNYKSWYKSTVGTDFKFKTCLSENGKRLKIQLWDSSGKERLQGTSKEFFLKMLGFVLVFDVTNEESFESIKSTWYKKTQLPAGTVHDPLTVRVLVGNKAEDSYEDGAERKISFEQGKKLAEELGLMYFETSAKTGKDVKDMFMLCANEIVDRIQENAEIYEKYKQTLY